MSELSLSYCSGDVEVDKRETLFKGCFQMDALTLRHLRFDGSWTEGIRREMFERGDGVALLPWHVESDTVIMIEQSRPVAIHCDDSRWVLEAVAGVVEPGERDSDVAHREAMEEAGRNMDALLTVVSYYPCPGVRSEQIRLFMGRVVTAAVGEVKGVDTEHEDILVHSVPRTDAIALLDAGKINNGLTIIAPQWLASNGDSLRAEGLE